VSLEAGLKMAELLEPGERPIHHAAVLVQLDAAIGAAPDDARADVLPHQACLTATMIIDLVGVQFGNAWGQQRQAGAALRSSRTHIGLFPGSSAA